MKTNARAAVNTETTHEGAPAHRINPEQALRRSVMSCLLWEREFYEDGESIADRIAALVPSVKPERVAAMAITARERMKLRHVPLWLCLAMCRSPQHRPMVAKTLARVIQRPDELTETLALLWKTKRTPIPAQIKKGLALAFAKFDAYSLAKYAGERDAIKLRDVLRITHPKPSTPEQEALWKQVLTKTLPTPMTWEVELTKAHTPEEKRATWERLLAEKKLFALALLRNLRNMRSVNVPVGLIEQSLADMRTDRVLPFRFLAAARYAPSLEPSLEAAMIRCVSDHPKLPGHTIVLVDVSGSMDTVLSSKSEMIRMDAAAGVAVLVREIAEQVSVYTFSNSLVQIPARRGMALRDAILQSQPHGATYLGRAINELAAVQADRLIVVTDEQSHDSVPASHVRGYLINVASAKNGVGYGAWTHIDGWSEAVLDYIRETETTDLVAKP